MSAPQGGEIASIRRGSPAHSGGLEIGDRVLAVNAHPIRDVIDFRFYSAEESLQILVDRAPGQRLTLQVERSYEDDIGVEFATPTFDGIRRCRNRCGFCFVDQMPPGLRQSLYIKDDDYRYSFLFGNFLTLTNLTEEDWDRLAEQHLSPLYVSVHSSERRLRARLLGVPDVPDILAQLGRLGSLGIRVHTQIVVTPGLNDGPVLERTVHDLASLFPAVASIALVPVGIARYHTCGLRPLTSQEARDIIRRITPLQREYARCLTTGLVQFSDELYLMAGQRLPPSRGYDGFPQLANGVGLTRQLVDDWKRAKKRGHPRSWRRRRATLVCGTLIAPTMSALTAELAHLVGAEIEVVPVPNEFFGSSVSVSGLLLAQDILSALRGRLLGDLLILPRAMFDATGAVTLDDCRQVDIERESRVTVVVAESLSDLCQL